MTSPFIGEIRAVGFTFAPRGWAACDGWIMAIQQNTALFSLLGTMYGGNGTTTFALPDLRGRAPIHVGQGPGLSYRDQGEAAGVETVTLTVNEMPSHTHATAANAASGTKRDPRGNRWAASAVARYGSPATGSMSPTAVSTNGGNLPHRNMPPYLTVNFVIALQGIFPARN